MYRPLSKIQYTNIWSRNLPHSSDCYGSRWILLEAQTWDVVVEDTSDPIPEISVEGVVVSEELILMTNQQVMFSALGTTDNLPLEELYFEWNWGDGEIESGIGLYESSHSWVDGSSDGIIYTLSLLVSDGIHDVEHTVFIRILNRVPQQIFDSQLQTYTLTPLELPTVFTDSDGMIVSYDWTFEEESILMEGA